MTFLARSSTGLAAIASGSARVRHDRVRTDGAVGMETGANRRWPARHPGHVAQLRFHAVRGAGRRPQGAGGGRHGAEHLEHQPRPGVRRPHAQDQREAQVDGGGPARRAGAGLEMGRGQARLRPRAHPRRARARDALGALRHARLSRRHVPGRLQQRLPDHPDAGLRGHRAGDDSRDAHHPDRRPSEARRRRSRSGTASRAAGGKATRWSSRAPTTTTRGRLAPARRPGACAASPRARR